ncbi:trypsin 3A1-like [Schistocerca serialis cubense]|uniref:trypsin 3A1-like n=1 Tax=Schistocerca serialis cubense TaxID=2023355 RepID=UPI00214E5674|nr:trypsin 3A1-like [Schistocerca serialis cubense]
MTTGSPPPEHTRSLRVHRVVAGRGVRGVTFHTQLRGREHLPRQRDVSVGKSNHSRQVLEFYPSAVVNRMREVRLWATACGDHTGRHKNGASVSGHGGRIVNGKPAVDHEFPALASLHVNGSHYCGANVLSENWLVTAAHCVTTSVPSQQYILAGTNSQTSGGSIHQVEQNIVHVNYTGLVGSSADIALLRVSSPLPVDGVTISTVTLPVQGQEVEDGANAVAAGWGYLSGDSGGPLYVNEQLVGLVSFSRYCFQSPSVYTRVPVFVDWIKENSQ